MPFVVKAVASAVSVLSLAVAALGTPPSALASHSQIAIFQDDPHVLTKPEQTLTRLRELGAGMVRVTVGWNTIAPAPSATRAPAHLNASNPAAYSAAAWAPYDTVVRDAHALGIAVDFTLTGPAPMWAAGRSQPRGIHDGWWLPAAASYGQFVQAVATRYSGTYQGLPRVSDWEIWNEPNFGEDLAPQANSNSSVLVAAPEYRALVDAAWPALQRTGHGHDTVILGNLDARGMSGRPTRFAPQGYPGYFSATKPLQFVRALYCVDAAYRPLRGSAAAAIGCPTTAAGSRGFQAAHPGLFSPNAFADHPYPANKPPNQLDSRDPDYVELPEIPHFAAVLDRLQRLYGSRRQFAIYNTEFGYITNPPNHNKLGYVSPSTAAYYLNWAEYISWRTPRIASYMQYQLYDPNPSVNVPEYGGFASGLILYNGTVLPTYNAYVLPLYLPVTTTRSGRSLEVWGSARPAYSYAQPQLAIQFQRGSRGPFTTLKTVSVTDTHGYFDLRMTFPASGSVRLAWSYPPATATGYSDPLASKTAYSRTVKVTIT